MPHILVLGFARQFIGVLGTDNELVVKVETFLSVFVGLLALVDNLVICVTDAVKEVIEFLGFVVERPTENFMCHICSF